MIIDNHLHDYFREILQQVENCMDYLRKQVQVCKLHRRGSERDIKEICRKSFIRPHTLHLMKTAKIKIVHILLRSDQFKKKKRKFEF